MTAVNKKRLLIWGFLFVLLLGLGGGGFALSRFMGYGDAGKVRTIVTPYIDRFNALNKVREINQDEKKSIKASFIDEGILVNYKNDKIKSDLKFILVQKDELEYLEASYNSSESNPETIVKLMIDAVGVKNGTIEGKIFDTFGYSDLMNTTLAEGVFIKPTTSGVKVQINLHANILNNASSSSDTPTDETNYVIIEDYSKEFTSYATFTAPSKFSNTNSGYVLSTDNDTCKAKFSIVSPESAGSNSQGLAIDVANVIAKGESTSTSPETVNGITWNKVSYPSVTGGKTTRYLADESGVILSFEFSNQYGTTECDEYQNSFLNSIKIKE